MTGVGNTKFNHSMVEDIMSFHSDTYFDTIGNWNSDNQNTYGRDVCSCLMLSQT